MKGVTICKTSLHSNNNCGLLPRISLPCKREFDISPMLVTRTNQMTPQANRSHGPSQGNDNRI